MFFFSDSIAVIDYNSILGEWNVNKNNKTRSHVIAIILHISSVVLIYTQLIFISPHLNKFLGSHEPLLYQNTKLLYNILKKKNMYIYTYAHKYIFIIIYMYIYMYITYKSMQNWRGSGQRGVWGLGGATATPLDKSGTTALVLWPITQKKNTISYLFKGKEDVGAVLFLKSCLHQYM